MMNKTTKLDLTVAVSRETGLVRQDVRNIVQTTLDFIVKALADGRTVQLRDFGSFELRRRKARVGRNPNAPAVDLQIPERTTVVFKPGRIMRESVSRPEP